MQVAHAHRRQQQRAGGIGVAEVDVLVLLLHRLVAARRYRLDDVVANRQFRLARRTAEGVTPIEHGRSYLVEIAQAIVAISHNAVGCERIALATGGQAVVPAVGGGEVVGVALAKGTVAFCISVAVVVLDALFAAFAPIEGIVVHIGQDGDIVVIRHIRTGRGRAAEFQTLGCVDRVGLIRLAIIVAVPVEIDLHARNAGFPVFHCGVARVFLGAHRGVLDDAGDAAVLAGRIECLAPLDHVGLTQEGLDALDQDGTGLGLGQVVVGVGVVSWGAHGLAYALGHTLDRIGLPVLTELLLRIELVPGGIAPARVDRHLAAAIHHDGGAGGLEAGEIDFRDQPVEEREDFVEPGLAIGIGCAGLINAAIPKAQVDGLVRQTDFIGIAEAVPVRIEEYGGLVAGKPVEHRHVDQVQIRAIHGDIGGSDDAVEELIPDHQLIGSIRHFRYRESAVRLVAGGGEQVAPAHHGQFVQADPAIGHRLAVVEGEVRWTRHVLVHHPPGDGVAAFEHAGVIGRLDESDIHMVSGGTELLEETGFIGLHPGVDPLGALDGGGLLPTRARGRNDFDGVFGGGQIFDVRHTIDAGENEAIAGDFDDAGAIRIHPGVPRHNTAELAARHVGIGAGLVSRADRVAIGILGDLAA